MEIADTKMAETEGRRSDPAALGAGGKEDSDLVMILMTDKVMMMMMMMWMILMMMMIMTMENSDQGKSKLQ